MYIYIDSLDERPIYQQVYDQIVGMIATGELEAAKAMPSIRMLAKDLKLSVITIKRAYEELEKDGFIETFPGKGSYVKAYNKEHMREQQRVLIQEQLAKVLTMAQQMDIPEEEVIELYKIMAQDI